jgi:hypothetical protein
MTFNMNSNSGDKPESDMQRFEELATRLFSIAKEDVEKAEEVAKEAAEDVLGPPPAPAPATDED